MILVIDKSFIRTFLLLLFAATLSILFLFISYLSIDDFRNCQDCNGKLSFTSLFRKESESKEFDEVGNKNLLEVTILKESSISVSNPPNSIDHVRLYVEVADNQDERAKGLMYRESLAEDKGMLFIFEKEGRGGFWMKNTLIPLDMIFVDKEKKVVAIIKDAEPCKVVNCPSYSPESEYLYVIEVNGGWVEQNQVKVGDVVQF